MKKTFALYLSLIFVINSYGQELLKGAFTYQGFTRTYIYYVPKSYSPDKPTSLIVNLHGYSSDNLQQLIYSNFQPIADTAGFIMVLPQGTQEPVTKLKYWNPNWYPNGVDDVGFIETVIDTMSAHFNIDPNRVYSTGISNGATMSIYLACKSNRFAAVASVSGGMSTTPFCYPAYPIPVMSIFGTKDPVGSYYGDLFTIPAVDLVSFWVNENQCNPEPITRQVPNTNKFDFCNAEHQTYTGGIDGHTVEFFKVKNGGHTWPGSPLAISSNGNTCMDFIASEEIWRFFRQHSRPVSVATSIKEGVLSDNFEVYPNPSSSSFNLQFKNIVHGTYSLLDVNGKTIKNGHIDNSSISINVSDIAKGLYLVQIISPEFSGVKKVIVGQ
ncbi:MAG: T9SS type A sorting domain-containing protein [Chitinophagales bacterium]|nr:T9SS type A sorting domain-containing protein [Chitinophagales bacterium]